MQGLCDVGIYPAHTFLDVLQTDAVHVSARAAFQVEGLPHVELQEGRLNSITFGFGS